MGSERYKFTFILLMVLGAIPLVSDSAEPQPLVPTEFRMEYIVFGYTEDVQSRHVEVYINKLHSPEQADQFMEENTEVEFDSIYETSVRPNDTLHIIFRVEEEVNGTWRPSTSVGVRCYLARYEDDGAGSAHENPDGTQLIQTDFVNESGMASFTMSAPLSSHSMWFIPQIWTGGPQEWSRLDGTVSRLLMVIPEARVSYVAYEISTTDRQEHLSMYHHTFDDDDTALAFLNGTFNVSFGTWSAEGVLYRDARVDVACFFEVQNIVGDWDWVPLDGGTAYVYILKHPYRMNIDIVRDSNWGQAVFDENIGSDGSVVLSIEFQQLSIGLDSTPGYRMVYAIFGGPYTSFGKMIEEANWTFFVYPPIGIELQDVKLLEDTVPVGSMMNIDGQVRYLGSGDPVEGATVTVTGAHVSTVYGLTDENGSFLIQLQAPIIVVNNLTLNIKVEESGLWPNTGTELTYDVIPPIPPPPPEPSRPYILYAVIISIGIAFTITAVVWSNRKDRTNGKL
jgi:hypothetical protein